MGDESRDLVQGTLEMLVLKTLALEPMHGYGIALRIEQISAGVFRNHGYQNLGVNLNYAAGRGVTVYANLRNALDQRYEEIFGYPSPLLNFVTGVKFSLRRSR